MDSIAPGTHSCRKDYLARRFFAGNAATYDWVVHLWTLGLDRFWKRKIIAEIPPAPRRLIDQACGTGILTLRLARRFPGCLVFGVDLNPEYLALADRKAGALGLGKNVAFIQGRAEDVFLKGPFDGIASSYLAKYADLEKLVEAAARMLRPGGVVVMHDFTYPENPFVRFFLGVYFRIMQALGSHAFPRWKTVFHELEDFLKHSRWASELAAALETHGFGRIHARRFTLGCAAVVSAVRR
jgi:demethylmenaquinone methyltransferase / 2-methoxy-6-polyprenyl-1,4-benzoquinol methylase